jgi:hypothetical protein
VLTAYLTATQELLENPVPSPPLYATTDLINYVNEAREQIAGEGECIVGLAQGSLTNAVPAYSFSIFSSFSALTPGGTALTGIQGVLTIRQLSIVNAAGTVNTTLATRPWFWMERYWLNSGAAIASGQPREWGQLGRGANGTFSIGPAPVAGNFPHINADCALLPIPLVDDTTPEAIPVPWQDAVPFYAAYKALLSAQRRDDANQMFQRFEAYMRRAVQNSTPTRYPTNFPGGRAAQIAASKVPLSGASQGGQS